MYHSIESSSNCICPPRGTKSIFLFESNSSTSNPCFGCHLPFFAVPHGDADEWQTLLIRGEQRENLPPGINKARHRHSIDSVLFVAHAWLCFSYSLTMNVWIQKWKPIHNASCSDPSTCTQHFTQFNKHCLPWTYEHCATLTSVQMT